MFNYFVSYATGSGFGNTKIVSKTELDSYEKIMEARESIEKENKLKSFSVVILSIFPLKN